MRKTNMKPSGIEGFYDIPVGWEINKMAYVFSFGKGLSITKEDLQDKGIPAVSYGDIHSRYGFEIDPAVHELRCVDPNYLKLSPNSLLKYGDFVFADTSEDIDGSGNFTHLSSDEAVFASYHTITARAIRTINFRYMAYLFDSEPFRTQIRNQVYGVKVFSITQLILKSAKILLPPLLEQQAIAGILDDRCRQIDGIIADLERQVEVLQQYKKALITEKVTKGMDKTAPMKDSGVEWIGEVPEHWGVKPLKYCVEINKNVLFESTNPNYAFRYIDIGSVTFDSGIIGYTDLIFDNAPSRARRIVKIGDTIISTVRTYLRAIAHIRDDDDVIVSTGFAVLTPKEDVNPSFLELYVKSDPFCDEVSRQSTGIAYPAINASQLGRIELLIPPKMEQERISGFLKQKCSEADDLIAEKQHAADVIRQYKKSLIYEYVTGKKRVIS